VGEFGDDFADVAFYALEEGGEVGLASADSVEVGLPLAGHGGAFYFGVDYFDEGDSFVDRLQRLSVSDGVVALEEDFDDGGAGGGGA
jgi:hypothetical protein